MQQGGYQQYQRNRTVTLNIHIFNVVEIKVHNFGFLFVIISLLLVTLQESFAEHLGYSNGVING